MADNQNVIGLAMELDVTDIKSGIKEVNNIIKSSKDEFNNATAGMDKWSKSSEGLTAKLNQLGKQMNAQEKAVAGYEAEIERVKNLEGDHTVQLEALNKKLQKAQAEVKKTQSQMSHYSDVLNDVKRAEKEAGSALGKLNDTINKQKKNIKELSNDYKSAVIQYGKNSNEAKALAAKIKELNKTLSENERKANEANEAEQNLGKSFEEVGIAAGEKAVKGLAKVGAAVGGLVTAFLATAEGTRELRTNMGKVNTAFEESGFSAQQAEETYKKFYGILGDEGQATEAVNHLSKLAKSQEDLSKWTDIATGVYATFGDSLPIENLTEAANETAKTGELTGGLVDALNWAGESEEDFQNKLDQCNNESERQVLITKTLTGLYGEASNAYKETNKDIIASNEAQAQLSATMADIGAKAEPLMTQVKLLGARILEALLPVIEKILPAIENHLPLVIGIVGTLVGTITTLSTAIAILKVKTELATIATIAKTTAEKIAAGTTKGLTAAQWLLNAAMSANPIGLIVIAIGALVAAFVVLWNKSEAFRKFWISLWDGIKKAAKVVIDAIGKFFSACWDGIKNAWNGAGRFFKGVFNGIVKIFNGIPNALGKLFNNAWDLIKKAFSAYVNFYKGIFNGIVKIFSTIGTSLGKLFSGAWDKIKNAFSNVTKFFSGVAENVVNGFKSLPKNMANVGKNLIEGLWNGVKNMTSWITGKLKSFSDGVLNGIKKFFGIHSPSTEMAEIGGYMAEGMAEGIEEGTAGVVEAGTSAGEQFAEGFTETATKGVDKGAAQIKGSFESLTDKIEKQRNKLAGLETRYKSIVMQFGATSSEAYAVGRQIITLSRELEENELKVKDLDDSYKGLSGTLATQMRIELNNAKNQRASLLKQQEEYNKLSKDAYARGDWSATKKWSLEAGKLQGEINLTDIKVKELTANLDYMAKKEREAAAEAKRLAAGTRSVAEETPKVLNAYEQLVEKIKKQEEELSGLKTEYESAVITFGETSTEAEKLANTIKKLTGEIDTNKKTVSELDENYADLTKKIEINPTETKSGWKKFIDDTENALGVSETKLQAWSEGSGKYVEKIGNYFESAGAKINEMTGAIGDYFDKKINAKIEKIDATIERLKISSDEEIEIAKKAADEQMAIINKMYDDEALSAEEYRERKKAIEQELADFTQTKNNETAAQEKKLLAEKDKIARKQFESQKSTSIAETLINGASAIIKGFAQLGPIGGAINAGIQAGITAAQVATIASQQYVPMLAKGGVADGATIAMIGEAGKEAVIPLERNTGWMNTLAEKLAAIMQKDLIGGVNNAPAYALAGGSKNITYNYQQVINAPKTPNRRELYRDGKNLLALKG